MSAFALSTRCLSKSFGGKPVLRDIAFDIPRGRVTSLIGRSGAGKSTLFRCLSGLEPMDSGEIVMNGQSLSPMNQRLLQRQVGVVFQAFNLMAQRTVLDNVLLPLQWHGLLNQTTHHYAQELLDAVGLTQWMHSYPAGLSGGQCQRVAIVRALATNPALLLCDEFTSALDSETIVEILTLLKKLQQSLGVTIFFVTHDMAVVRDISDSVIVMDQGEIAEVGDVEQVFLQPQHPRTQQLIYHLFRKELPVELRDKLSKTPTPNTAKVVLKVLFVGQQAHTPIIAELIQKHGLPINILAGHIDHIRNTPFGKLIVSLPIQDIELSRVQELFQLYGATAEVLGFLEKNL